MTVPVEDWFAGKRYACVASAAGCELRGEVISCDELVRAGFYSKVTQRFWLGRS